MQTHETWPSQVGSLSIFVATDPRLSVGCSHHWSEYPLNFGSSGLQGARLSFVCMGKTVAFGRWHRSPSGRWQSRVGGKGRDNVSWHQGTRSSRGTEMGCEGNDLWGTRLFSRPQALEVL